MVLAGGSMAPLLPDLEMAVIGIDVLGLVAVPLEAEVLEVAEATLPRLDCGPVVGAAALTAGSVGPAAPDFDLASECEAVVGDLTTLDIRGPIFGFAGTVVIAGLGGAGESGRVLVAVETAATLDLIDVMVVVDLAVVPAVGFGMVEEGLGAGAGALGPVLGPA